MGEIYVPGDNPMNDVLLELLNYDQDITDEKIQGKLFNRLANVLLMVGINDEDIKYLDYKIKKNNDIAYMVVGNNIITALWFVGIIPYNCEEVMKINYIVFNNRKYKYNKKTKKLSWKKINE